MTNLYDISKQIEEISQMVDEDGVLLPEAEERLEELEISKVEKFRNIAWLIRNIQSNVDSLKTEKMRLANKQRIEENKVDRLKKYLKFIMERDNINKIQAGIFDFSLRNNQSVQIQDWVLLPEEYTKTVITPNKTDLKKAIKNWEEIEGVEIIITKSLTIK